MISETECLSPLSHFSKWLNRAKPKKCWFNRPEQNHGWLIMDKLDAHISIEHDDNTILFISGFKWFVTTCSPKKTSSWLPPEMTLTLNSATTTTTIMITNKCYWSLQSYSTTLSIYSIRSILHCRLCLVKQWFWFDFSLQNKTKNIDFCFHC